MCYSQSMLRTALVCVVSVAAFGATYSVAVIPAPSGLTIYNIIGINDSGQVAGTGSIGATNQAFIGSPSGSTAIPLLAGWRSSFGAGINNSGQMVGSVLGGLGQAFIGTVAGGIVIPLPAGWTSAGGIAVNASGQVAGSGSTFGSGPPSQAFIGSISGSTAIPLPAGWSSAVAQGVNAAGQVTGYGANGAATLAFIGTTSGSTAVPMLSGWSFMQGEAINDSGYIAGLAFEYSGAEQAFIGTASGSTAIPLPIGATSSWVADASQSINNLGTVVGSSNAGAWIWDASHGTVLLSDLVPVAWNNVTNAISISNNGLILASASYQGGAPQIVELVPCTYSLSSTSISPGVAAVSSSVMVTCPAGCDWTAVSNASWVTIISGASGTGNGTVNFDIAANPGAGRVGTLTVAGQTFTVNQAGLPSPPVLSSPTNGAVAVSLTPALMWSGSSGATSYDVYFGTSPTPPFAVNTTSATYSPGTLSTNTTYYWQIVAKNLSGTTSSAMRSFTTQRLAGGPVIPALDFNGDGNQDVFLYDPVAGGAFAGLSNGSGGFTFVFNFFNPGFDTIRYGVLNAGGKSGVVAYNSTSALGYALPGTGTGTFTAASMFWGPGFTKVAAGDLNGDGLTDFVIYRPTDGTSYTAISNGDGTFRYQYMLVSGGFTHLVVADFNGDGKADVLFYRSSDGLAYLGTGNGTGGFTFSPVALSAGYTFIESGDINGDGSADLLLYNGTSGSAAVGLSTGSGFNFTPFAYSPGFTTVKLFDFNGDGLADVALYNMNNAIGYLGISNGTSAFTFGSLFWGPGFSIVDALDLNGDGKIDIVIYNSSNAASYTAISSGSAASPFTSPRRPGTEYLFEGHSDELLGSEPDSVEVGLVREAANAIAIPIGDHGGNVVGDLAQPFFADTRFVRLELQLRVDFLQPLSLRSDFRL